MLVCEDSKLNCQFVRRKKNISDDEILVDVH